MITITCTIKDRVVQVHATYPPSATEEERLIGHAVEQTLRDSYTRSNIAIDDQCVVVDSVREAASINKPFDILDAKKICYPENPNVDLL